MRCGGPIIWTLEGHVTTPADAPRGDKYAKQKKFDRRLSSIKNFVLKNTNKSNDDIFVATFSLARIGFTVALLGGATAQAAAGQPDEQLAGAPLEMPAAQRPLPRLGLMVGGGVPDGATGSAVFRPFSWLRTEAGLSYNLIIRGVRAGVSVLPFGAGPSATFEAGHYFSGNANGIARSIAGAGFHDSAILQKVGYDYANAHLGLDFGTRRVVFFLHGGMSYIRADVHNVNAQIASAMSGSSSTTVTFSQDPQVRVLTPSAKLGLIFYIW